MTLPPLQINWVIIKNMENKLTTKFEIVLHILILGYTDDKLLKRKMFNLEKYKNN